MYLGKAKLKDFFIGDSELLVDLREKVVDFPRKLSR